LYPTGNSWVPASENLNYSLVAFITPTIFDASSSHAMFKHLSIKTRLIFLTVLLSAVAILVGTVGLVNQGATNAALGSVYNDRLMVLTQLSRILSLMQQNQNALTSAALAAEPDNGPVIAEVEGRIGEISALWDAYKAKAQTPDEQALARAFIESRMAFVRDGLKPTMAALRASDAEATRTLVKGLLKQRFLAAQKNMQALVRLQQDLAKAQYDQALARYEHTRNLSIAMIVIGSLAGACVAALLIRGIGASLAEALRLARSVAAGDLTQTVRIEHEDEIGQLLTALQAMNTSLAGIVGEVRHSTDTIATATNQIAAGNQDLAARTEQQASSLEETAASMEELTSNVKHNADNARQANALAEAASGVAGRGGAVIREVVGTMGEISESSRRIGEIIGVIDGIAFQTNILALNAAVEAARAGEQGRGFAVVASEVRNLAQRSAGAAREIKQLIERSVERVEAGGRLVEQAGATMHEIVASVHRVTDIMAEITAASTEQTAGIGQINVAMAQMEQVTQQNAALVEQAASAAGSMHEQAQRLAASVNVFRIGKQAAPRAAVPAPVRPRRALARA
jgi:methyl-accepting chemotaxis protein-1 (serine sensor receptor)